MKPIIIRKVAILLLFATFYQTVYPCSVFKYTTNGKTYVGNNEDYYNPFTWMWVKKPTKKRFGIVYFGYDDFFPQGGINEKGLVFDGFSMPYLEVKNIANKKKVASHKLMDMIMASCTSVEEVKEILLRHNLAFLDVAQLIFIDKSGTTLLVEGDEMILSEGSYFVATNFYQSKLDKSEYKKSCWRYSKAETILSKELINSAEFGVEVLDSINQEGFWGGTQYSNLYDLDKGTIHLFLFHNFTEGVELSVKDLLSKGNHKVELYTLFKKTEKYNKYKSAYTKSRKLVDKLSEIKDSTVLKKKTTELKQFKQAELWTKDIIKAVEIHFEQNRIVNSEIIVWFLLELLPDSWQIKELAAKLLYEQKKYTLALKYIDQSLILAPNNKALMKAKQMIEENIQEKDN